ncbi:PspC domain-containing protein [Neobacillus sp. PS3-40]|uniref:PspC domain-containing protein n=1 Tax=Neobacillus sp. PS3-40 TaxID=3070679 RepID=UPI0027DECA90|nr:PspC domain-containing protein [Neobacillus sp. PS3-40]WML44584.1 PspC domain-containing protein [Neobacillus sp. PS3-40]
MNRLTKSSKEKALLGVCGGLAEHFGISPFLVRLIFIFTPVSFFIYLILAVLLPENNSSLY